MTRAAQVDSANDPKRSAPIPATSPDDDDVYLDKLQTRGVKKIFPLHVKRRPANKAKV
jgi:hypothetical protein